MSSPYCESFRRVVSCESRIVHMFHYLCLYSLHLLHRTLYRRTHSLPFFCASNVHTTSVVSASVHQQPYLVSAKDNLEYLDNWNTITIQYLYIQYNTIQYLDNLESSNRMLVPELDLIIVRSWNRQNDVTVTLNIARKKWKFWKKRSLRVQTSCKDFDQIGIQQPDACTWAELKFKFWRGNTRNSRIEFHSNLRGRYPPWTSKGSPTFVKNLRNVI